MEMFNDDLPTNIINRGPGKADSFESRRLRLKAKGSSNGSLGSVISSGGLTSKGSLGK